MINPEHKILANEIVLLKEKAMRLGLYRTGRMLEIPIIEIGWEMQGEQTPMGQMKRQENILML